MLNFNCDKVIQPRQIVTLSTTDSAINETEALNEASRCLAARSCEACNLCRLMCPDLAITQDHQNGQIQIDLLYCKGCGICAAVCPKKAISMVLEKAQSD